MLDDVLEERLPAPLMRKPIWYRQGAQRAYGCHQFCRTKRAGIRNTPSTTATKAIVCNIIGSGQQGTRVFDGGTYLFPIQEVHFGGNKRRATSPRAQATSGVRHAGCRSSVWSTMNMNSQVRPSQIDCGRRPRDLAEVRERCLTIWDRNLTSGDIERATAPPISRHLALRDWPPAPRLPSIRSEGI